VSATNVVTLVVLVVLVVLVDVEPLTLARSAGERHDSSLLLPTVIYMDINIIRFIIKGVFSD
jgi:hypothetical protein